MHYRNGREAHNGDIVLQLGFDGKPEAFGVLHSATPGDDYCNGMISPLQDLRHGACLIDCLHVEDIMAMLQDAGLDKRPEGK